MISPHGQGRRRTLQDIRQSLPASLKIVFINIRDYKTDFKALYNAVTLQEAEIQPTPKKLESLLDRIELEGKKQLFILHNFDELRYPGVLSNGYHCDFIQTLNTIKQRRHIALLCVSESGYDQALLDSDGSALPGSNLNATPVLLPPMTSEQIKTELQRRQRSLTPQELDELARSLLQTPAPYSAIETLILDKLLWSRNR